MLFLCGGIVLVYSMLVLGIVAAAPDLGIRCLLSDNPWPNGVTDGVVMRTVPKEGVHGKLHPVAGDRLVTIDGVAGQYVRRLHALANAALQRTDAQRCQPPCRDRPIRLRRAADRSLNTTTARESWRLSLSRRVKRWRTLRSATSRSDPLPLSEVLFSLFWFLLQTVALAIGAAVYWNRPFDRASQLFYSLCLVTLGAFLGTSHWWIVASSFWLTAPCVICAMLLPAVCLHFFLVFPRTWLPLVWRPRTSLALIYGLPIAGMLGLLTLTAICSWPGLFAPNVMTIRQLLDAIRLGIYGSLVVGGVYFVVTMARVLRSYRSTRNAVEQIQLKLLWRAGVVTAVCLGVTLYLALFDRENFALGAARVWIFLAGLCFTVAYAYGIIRYRLLLVDQIVTKGVMYYLANCGLTVAFALMLALSPIARQYLNVFPLTQQSAIISVVLMLAVILLLWLRDMFQGMIDRRFYREKYQLGKALERMNRAVGRLADPEAVAALMLSSCRDVLGVDRAALYLRTSADAPFRLISAYGAESLPRQFPAEHPLIQGVMESGNLQRALLGSMQRSVWRPNGPSRTADRPRPWHANRNRNSGPRPVGREANLNAVQRRLENSLAVLDHLGMAAEIAGGIATRKASSENAAYLRMMSSTRPVSPHHAVSSHGRLMVVT